MKPGEKIQIARKSRRPRVSQADVAAALGISRDQFANYESSRSEPPASIIRKLARLWRMPEMWFWDENDPIVPGHARAIERQSNPLLNLVPFWGGVPCGDWQAQESDPDWIEISESIDPRNVIAVRVQGHSMAPRLRRGQTVVIKLDQEPREGVISLAANGQRELTLKVLEREKEEWVLRSINPEYGTVTAENWEILGYAIGIEEVRPEGLRP